MICDAVFENVWLKVIYSLITFLMLYISAF